MKYKEQLADSRWLQKKTEILIRDNYSCRKCGAKSNLNVHHLSYEEGKLAWEYQNEKLITLCKKCHEKEHNIVSYPIVGSFYKYYHSDYTDYVVCYHVDKYKELVYLFGVDDGSGYGDGWFLCLTFNEYFSKCANWILSSNIEEDYYLGGLLLAYERETKRITNSLVIGCTEYSDIQVRDYAVRKLKDIIEHISKNK